MLEVDYIVNSIFDSITWLLSETESNQVWLIDCGDYPPIQDKVGDKTIKGVLLTHAHFDHIYGLPELLEKHPDCRIFTNMTGQKALADSKLNLSFYNESPIWVEGQFVSVCHEGSVIPLFNGVEAKVFETPGHHPSCLTFVVDDSIFTGDAYIPGLKTVTHLPGGDKKLANESLERIFQLAQGKRILCGHKNNMVLNLFK